MTNLDGINLEEKITTSISNRSMAIEKDQYLTKGLIIIISNFIL